MRCDVRPVRAVVARDLDQPVVGADPQLAARERRFRDGEDGVVVLDAGDVLGDRSARGDLLGLVVAREIAADCGPALARVTSF